MSEGAREPVKQAPTADATDQQQPQLQQEQQHQQQDYQQQQDYSQQHQDYNQQHYMQQQQQQMQPQQQYQQESNASFLVIWHTCTLISSGVYLLDDSVTCKQLTCIKAYCRLSLLEVLLS